ncbi:WGxxGxxG family protein [Amycolatopsis plumensis]|uniref:WGxxGxxG family protein n=1 Tax=Amycolatopsis plumensis TaxID=236508 RepID=A0ABV5U3W7_9PSEU
MNRKAGKLCCAGVAAAAFALTGAVPASAAPEFTAPAWHQQTDDGTNHDNNARDDDNDNNGLWGLLGLVGLLGLAGLIRRDPKPGAMAGYPAAAPTAPPANTYPPAEPRRNPPGV